jgi:hypothetical protein
MVTDFFFHKKNIPFCADPYAMHLKQITITLYGDKKHYNNPVISG